jgi:uncharacterized protein (DUF983 family)
MEESTEEEFRVSRPLPCPECLSAKGFNRVGKFRSQCQNCNALIPNSAIDQEDQEPQ